MPSKPGRNGLTKLLIRIVAWLASALRRVGAFLVSDVDLRAFLGFSGFALSLILVEIAQKSVPDPWRQVVNLVCFAASIFFASMLVAHLDSEYSRVAACGTGLFCFVIIFLIYFDVGMSLFSFLIAALFSLLSIDIVRPRLAPRLGV
jgi:hypothetical protein